MDRLLVHRVARRETSLYRLPCVRAHTESGIRNIGCEEYRVPHNVSDHLDYITPGIRLMAHGYDGETIRRAKMEQVERSGLKEKRVTDILTAEGPSRLAMAIPMDELAYQATPPRVVPGLGCDMYSTVECIRGKSYPTLPNICIKYVSFSHYVNRPPPGPRAIPNSTKQPLFPKRQTRKVNYQGLGQHYSQGDLDLFFWNMYPSIPNGTHPDQDLVNDAYGPSSSQSLVGSEATLDFQVTIAYPLGWPSNPVLWQINDEVYEINQTNPNTPYNGVFNNFWNAMDGSYCSFDAYGLDGNCERGECSDAQYPNPHPDGWKGDLMCGEFEPTAGISMSYAGAEVDLPPLYHRRRCLELLKLGLRGVSVVVSSGDDGVASLMGDPYPNGCLGEVGGVFNPMFLAACPYVTAVGDTLVGGDEDASEPNEGISYGAGTLAPINGSNSVVVVPSPLKAQGTIYTETAPKQFKSGGVFSNLLSRPWYQTNQVHRCLSDTDLP
ncbi:subtilisin-like protein [Zalerion maritima]|uniref:Subtilisin-like protein n=1 Tax=Zalerion maritima TaxID=339359 RepID=A0AAD5WQU4_9PEZI|nr:subtilisin-like protein [Zalerion maritima]